jgi:hypothetical protein
MYVGYNCKADTADTQSLTHLGIQITQKIENAYHKEFLFSNLLVDFCELLLSAISLSGGRRPTGGLGLGRLVFPRRLNFFRMYKLKMKSLHITNQKKGENFVTPKRRRCRDATDPHSAHVTLFPKYVAQNGRGLVLATAFVAQSRTLRQSYKA